MSTCQTRERALKVLIPSLSGQLFKLLTYDTETRAWVLIPSLSGQLFKLWQPHCCGERRKS
mgnify:CR=1 FL=1